MTEAPIYPAIRIGILPVTCPSCSTRFDGSPVPAGVPFRCPRCHSQVPRGPSVDRLVVAPNAAATLAAEPGLATVGQSEPPPSKPDIPVPEAAAPATVPVPGSLPGRAPTVTAQPILPTMPGPIPSKPRLVHVVGVIALVAGALELIVTAALGIHALSVAWSDEAARGLCLTALGCQLVTIVQFAALVLGGVLLVCNQPFGRRLVIVHALSLMPIFLMESIAIHVAETLASLDGRGRGVDLVVLAAPFASVLGTVLTLLLNGTVARRWAHQHRIARGRAGPVEPPPASMLAVWSALLSWWVFPPLLSQILAIVFSLIGLASTRGPAPRRSGRGYAVYGLVCASVICLTVVAGVIVVLVMSHRH